MPSAKVQKQYLQTRITKAIYHLQLFCKKESVEQLHQLRVEIKKIKSLLRFSNDCNANKLKKQLKLLQEIFTHAGKIRNAHIYLGLTNTPTGTKFRLKQSANKKIEWQKFSANCDLYIAHLLKVQSIAMERIQHIAGKKADRWYKQQIKKTTGLLVNEEGLHDARKRIKRILHISDLHNPTPALNKPYLKKLENYIGKWHDVIETTGELQQQKALSSKLKIALAEKQKKLENLIRKQSVDFEVRAKK